MQPQLQVLAQKSPCAAITKHQEGILTLATMLRSDSATPGAGAPGPRTIVSPAFMSTGAGESPPAGVAVLRGGGDPPVVVTPAFLDIKTIPGAGDDGGDDGVEEAGGGEVGGEASGDVGGEASDGGGEEAGGGEPGDVEVLRGGSAAGVAEEEGVGEGTKVGVDCCSRRPFSCITECVLGGA